MLAAIAWTAWRFGKEHWLDLDRMGERGRAVLYGAIALVALAMAGRVTMWASVGGSLVWLTMVVAAAAGAFRSWQLWRSL